VIKINEQYVSYNLPSTFLFWGYLTSMNEHRCQIYWIFFDSDCWYIIVVLVFHADIILIIIL